MSFIIKNNVSMDAVVAERLKMCLQFLFDQNNTLAGIIVLSKPG